MWKFFKHPDNCWSVSLGCWLILWLLFPAVRPITSFGMLVHLPILIAGIVSLRLGFFCRSLCHLPGETQRLAITFDDGPDPRLTPELLEILDDYGVKATFFCIAEKVKQYPRLAHSILDHGHTIGSHDLQHRPTDNFRRYRKMMHEILESCSVIASVTGRFPRLYRPPVGLSNPHLGTVLTKLDMECIGWNQRIGDGGNRFAQRFSRMERCARAGSVIMLHDFLPVEGHKDLFLKNVRKLCERMRSMGLTGVTIDTLFSLRPYRKQPLYKVPC